jgi:hypothetical protein
MLCAAPAPAATGWAGIPPPLVLLQGATVPREPRGLQETRGSERSPEEKNADRAVRELTEQERKAGRKIRLAHFALIEQLLQMPLPERQRFLAENPRIQRMPAPQRRRIQQLTQRLSRLPAEEQILLLERYRLFLDLPPQKQQQARRIYGQWRQIEAWRRRELLREVEQLRDATPETRRERLQSEEFSNSYSVHEQRVLRGLTDLFP